MCLAVLHLGNEDPLQVERCLGLLSDAPDDVLGHRATHLTRERLDASALLDDACVAQRDRRMRREPFEGAPVVSVERSAVKAPHCDRRSELAVEEDGYADERMETDVAHRRHGRGLVGVVVHGHGRAATQYRTDDAHMCGRVDANDAFAGSGTGRDVELLAAPDIDRRVVRVGEKQRAARDAPEERHRFRLRGDLCRDPLETSAQAQRALRACLLGPVTLDRG